MYDADKYLQTRYRFTFLGRTFEGVPDSFEHPDHSHPHDPWLCFDIVDEDRRGGGWATVKMSLRACRRVGAFAAVPFHQQTRDDRAYEVKDSARTRAHK